MKNVQSVAWLLVVCVVMMCLGATFVSAENDIITIKNANLEVDENGDGMPDNWSMFSANADYVTTGGYDGGAYVKSKVATSEAVLLQQIVQGIRPNSVVEVSFYMKQKVANKAWLDIYFKDSVNATVSNTKFTIGDVVSTENWFKYTRRLFMVDGATGISITAKSGAVDVAFDNFELKYIDDGNMLSNGDFEIQNTSVWPQRWSVANWGTDASLVEGIEGANGKCLSVNTGTFVYQDTIPAFNGKGCKLSFRFMSNTATGAPYIQFGNGSNGMNFAGPAAGQGAWKTYNVYFVLQSSPVTLPFYLRNTVSGATAYYDDVKLTYEDITIDLYDSKQTDLAADTSVARTYFKSEELTSLKSGTLYVYSRFNTKDPVGGKASALACVYEYDLNNNKRLYSCSVASLNAASNLSPGFATTEVIVPENTETVTYKVEMLLWNGLNEMTPIIQKTNF